MSYDDWRSTDTTPDYLTEKDMTQIEGLERVRKHLHNVARELDAAEKEGTLTRGRLSRLRSIEAEAHDILADIDEELAHR